MKSTCFPVRLQPCDELEVPVVEAERDAEVEERPLEVDAAVSPLTYHESPQPSPSASAKL